MAIFKKIKDISPIYGNDCFFADNAAIIGDVIMGDNCSVWFSAVVRGDVNSIKIGNNVNIQDGSVLHCLYKKSTIEIGNNVSIGHNVTIHGAKIEDNVLVGMGATILDYSVIGTNSIVAAGSLILEGTKVEANSIYAGVPAKKIKNINPEQSNEMIKKIANNYSMYASWFK
ncbi:MAG: gamma carbonic anhydrase family protein [Bacteroidetes bacterium]|nr:MAG: gamma carbonic anhydrase family protein [Bacteroidota bacterium]